MLGILDLRAAALSSLALSSSLSFFSASVSVLSSTPSPVVGSSSACLSPVFAEPYKAASSCLFFSFSAAISSRTSYDSKNSFVLLIGTTTSADEMYSLSMTSEGSTTFPRGRTRRDPLLERRERGGRRKGC